MLVSFFPLSAKPGQLPEPRRGPAAEAGSLARHAGCCPFRHPSAAERATRSFPRRTSRSQGGLLCPLRTAGPRLQPRFRERRWHLSEKKPRQPLQLCQETRQTRCPWTLPKGLDLLRRGHPAHETAPPPEGRPEGGGGSEAACCPVLPTFALCAEMTGATTFSGNQSRKCLQRLEMFSFNVTRSFLLSRAPQTYIFGRSPAILRNRTSHAPAGTGLGRGTRTGKQRAAVARAKQVSAFCCSDTAGPPGPRGLSHKSTPPETGPAPNSRPVGGTGWGLCPRASGSEEGPAAKPRGARHAGAQAQAGR